MNRSITKAAPSMPYGQQVFEQFSDRTLLYANHPVVTDRYQFPTPPLVRAMDHMMHIISAGAPSGVFLGFPRFGKSWAIKYARTLLPEAFPDFPIITFHAHQHLIPNAGRFFGDLFTQSGYVLKGSNPYRFIREQLSRAWCVEAQSRGAHTIVLFGDEMQRLSVPEFTWLIDVSNDLQAQDIRMISILFAQPDLIALRSHCVNNGRGDILGRFLTRWHSFDGIANPEELRRVLECYDDPEQGEYPSGSGCSYTQFFLPLAYEAGWRLSRCASLVWELFAAQINDARAKSRTPQIQIGMQWIASAIQFALTHYGDEDRRIFSIKKDQWKAAIDSTGFAQSIGLTYDPDWGSAHEQLRNAR